MAINGIIHDSDFYALDEGERLRKKPSSEWDWERAEDYQSKIKEIGFDTVTMSEVGDVRYGGQLSLDFSEAAK